MSSTTYDDRRGALETYFDATAMDAWAQLTSDAPVSRIRQTVRAGRDRMRDVLLSWLPQDMTHTALLDAGCGTGALSVAAAERGAQVTAIDIAGNLIKVARERAPSRLLGSIDFRVGDMLSPGLGGFDHVAAMDSLIHYPTHEIIKVLTGLAGRTGQSIVFTFAPSTPALMLMLAMGRLFPRANRSPAIEPVMETRLRRAIEASPGLSAWRVGRTARVASGFYTSQAMELVRR
jgi:magnesium-protoporphyrin O-methyltransferase